MNRKDYRKMMQRKKMNKIYSKSLILGLLGLGVSISGNTIVKAEQREWKANTSTTIKKGDTEYKILWGDTLSLISRDSGITIETLTQLNNILDANLIYEGNIIYFGNGATATVKDESGNVIAETPLTPADKEGIKEAQKNNTNSTNSTTTSNVNAGNSSNNVSSNTTNSSSANSNNGNNTSNKPTNPTKPEKPDDEGTGSETGKPEKTNDEGTGSETGKPEKPNDEGNGSETEKPDKPTEEGNGSETEKPDKPTEEGNGSETEKPEITEFDKNVIYQVEGEGTVFSYPTKVKVEGTVKDDSGKFDIEYGFIDTTEKLPEGYKLVNEKESNVKVFNTTANIVIYVEKIEDEKPVEPEAPTETPSEKPEEKPETPVAKEVTATVNYLEDGNIIHTTTEKVKLGEDGFGTVNAVAPEGYDIVGDTSATVSETNTNVVFNVKKQAPAVEKVNVPVIYNLVDENGTFIKTLETSTQEFTKGDTVTVTAPTNVQGNTLVGSASQVVTVTDGTQVVFNYVAPYVPQHTTENVTVNVDTDGNVLSSTDGYEKVSESTDGGKVTTQPNGDTHTVYTTTVVWQKQVVTPPTTGAVSGEQFGGVLTSASETDSALPVNGYTFPDKASATAYGNANQEYIASLPENKSGRDDFLIFSVTMKDGSVRWAIEWKYILNG